MFKEIFFTLIAVCGVDAEIERKTDAKIQDIIEVKTDTKMQDIVELIHVAILQEEQLDIMLMPLAQRLITSAKSDMDVKNVVAEAKEKILSEVYLKRFIDPFDKIFTHDEIQLLLSYYKADAVKKLFKTGAETFLPIYTGMQEVIADIIKFPFLEGNVIPVTASNFQKEVKEFKGSVLLKVYSMMCGPCQVVTPIFSELSTELGNTVKFCQIDLTFDLELLKELEVTSVPTILFIKDGKIIDRHTGLISKEELKNKVVESGIASAD
ncbi:MAG: thioredoxin family protein [Candidatus Rhabdochlamydia sp.]